MTDIFGQIRILSRYLLTVDRTSYSVILKTTNKNRLRFLAEEVPVLNPCLKVERDAEASLLLYIKRNLFMICALKNFQISADK